MTRQPVNLLLAGVGGQGVVLAGDVIGEAAIAAGYDVKKTDTLGMAQRGGSVVSHLRLGEKVHSPLIGWGDADILLAFEKLEAARWVAWLKPGAPAIVNDYAQPPLSVSLGIDEYPGDESVRQLPKERTGRYYVIDGPGKAAGLGDTRAVNIFLVGCASRFLPVAEEIWKESLARLLPAGILDMNMKAFALGREVMADAGDR